LGLLVDRESRHGHGRGEEQVISLLKGSELGPELVYGQQGTGVISARDLCSMLETLTSVGRQLVGLLLQQMPISSIGIGAKNAPEGREWVVQSNVGIFYVAAQAGKDTRRLGGDLRHVWINGGIPKINAPPETQPPHTVVQSSEEIGRYLTQTTDITRIGAGQHLQEKSGGADSARHGA